MTRNNDRRRSGPNGPASGGAFLLCAYAFPFLICFCSQSFPSTKRDTM